MFSPSIKLMQFKMHIYSWYILLFLTESMYDVQTKIFPVDFNNHDCYERVESALSDLEIGVLGL